MPKPRPTDEEALFLIYMRRERARVVLNEILHGFADFRLQMPTAYQMLDYLTNTIQYLEMMLKLLSGDWGSHKVGTMYRTVTGQAHADATLMAALEAATMDQKYLMSPAAGIIDHIPELEEMGDALHARLRDKYRKFGVRKDEVLPDSFARYLVDNIERFYRTGPFAMPPGGVGVAAATEGLIEAHGQQVDAIRSNLDKYLSTGNKLSVFVGMGKALF